MAIGKAGVEVDISKVDLFVDDVQMMMGGGRHPEYVEEAGAAVMANEEITITVDLNAGDCTESVWTSDLSPEYVAINAEYRT